YDEHLHRLKASETITSSSSLSWKLNDLSALHECTDKISMSLRESETLPVIHPSMLRLQDSCAKGG
ncbi:hypothetical protein A2U01_0080850, partial [Trifolium medium]|nr:hypothetical protein [Trifolium medium]